MIIGSRSVFSLKEGANSVDNGTIDRLHASVLVLQCDTNGIEEDTLAFGESSRQTLSYRQASAEDIWSRQNLSAI